MKENIVYNKAYSFALEVVKVYQKNTNKSVHALFLQFLRSGTSIGANLSEANGSISNAEFSAKVSIAYKETLETKFWINLLHDSNYLIKDEFDTLISQADEIGKLLFSILRSTGRIRNDKHTDS